MATVMAGPSSGSRGSKMKNVLLHSVNEFVGTSVFLLIGFNAVMFVTMAEAFTATLTGPLVMAVQITGILVIGLFFGIGVALGIIVSGAYGSGHLNPAVSLMSLLFRKDAQTPPAYVLGNIIGQFFGAAVALSLVCVFYRGNPVLRQTLLAAPGPGDGYTTGTVWASELIGSFIFFLVVAQVANSKLSTAAVAAWVGLALAAMVSFFGLLSGGSFNPARGYVPMIFARLLLDHRFPLQVWLAVGLAPVIAAFAAALVRKLLAQAKDPATV